MLVGQGHLRYRLLLVIVMLVAAGLRFHALTDVPPGMTHDEADHGLDAWRVVQGERPLYFTVGYGREPLFDYSTAVLMSFLGPTYLAGRLTAVFFSLFLIAGTAAWARRAFDAPTALLAAAGLAVAFWPLMTARHALRTVTMPALLVAGLASFWRGKDAAQRGQRAWPAWLAAALWLGLSFYAYIPARITWLLLPAAGLYLWLRRAPGARRIVIAAAGISLLALLIGLPLFAYLRSHPGAEVRIDQLAAPLRQAAEGSFEPLFGNAWQALGLFSVRGDGAWRYNIAGRPWLPLLPSLLFYAGLLVAVGQAVRAKAHQGVAAFTALLWLLLGLAPALVTGPELSTTQAIALQPVLFIFPALALSGAARWAAPRVRQPALLLLAVVAFPLFAGWSLLTYHAYFGVWARQPEVAMQYEAELVAAVRYLDSQEPQTVAIATDAPGRFHDPATARLFRQGDALSLRWFDGRHSLLLPAAAGDSSLFYMNVSAPAPALAPFLDAVTDRVSVLPQGSHYHVDKEAGFQRLYPQFSPSIHTLSTELSTVPVFGGLVRFAGVHTSATARPGDTLLVATLWEVTGTAPPDLVLFTHLLDTQGQSIAQADRLDVPSDQWQPGDIFVQLHELVVPADIEGRGYQLVAGFYPAADWRQRLPLVAAGEVTGDLLPIALLEIGP
ncbi:MAG: hypothetical protein RRC07_05745 [Anaerolineae bacterium]|nr:hypothetical protein [Anaerolineae bacterium]